LMAWRMSGKQSILSKIKNVKSALTQKTHQANMIK